MSAVSHSPEAQTRSLSRDRLMHGLRGAVLIACAIGAFSGGGGYISLIFGVALTGLSLIFAGCALSSHAARERLKKRHQVEAETRQMQYNLADLREEIMDHFQEVARKAALVFLLHARIV